jgi:hypothetical protein
MFQQFFWFCFTNFFYLFHYVFSRCFNSFFVCFTSSLMFVSLRVLLCCNSIIPLLHMGGWSMVVSWWRGSVRRRDGGSRVPVWEQGGGRIFCFHFRGTGRAVACGAGRTGDAGGVGERPDAPWSRASRR